jgi:carboxyl-terminal processing protease
MIRKVLFAVSGFVAMLALLSGAFALGYVTHDQVRAAAASTPAAAGTDYALLIQAQAFLDQYYLREQAPPAVRQYAAIRAVLATLGDKFTFFVEPPVTASESNVLAGTYGGIGVQVRRDTVARFVLFPFPDSPAYKAGVRDNDLLIAVNGQAIPVTTAQDAVDQLLRGEVKDGNGVSITIQHQDGKQVTVQVPFAVIDVPSVVWRVLAEAPNVGYIQLMRFTNRTPDEMRKAISELTAAQVKALVLDMRNNPGGLLDESVMVAGFFLDGGVVYVEKTRDGTKEFNAPSNAALTKLPMDVLVNGGTASAAEIVAGALHDRGRAKLIGQKTYGKGSVQFIVQLADKSSMHITNSEWLPPSRTKLDGVGLTPDTIVEPDKNGGDAELAAALVAIQASAAH